MEFRKEFLNKNHNRNYVQPVTLEMDSRNFIYNLEINKNDELPFVPIIRYKPNAIVPLD